jgi:hypothetical protein
VNRVVDSLTENLWVLARGHNFRSFTVDAVNFCALGTDVDDKPDAALPQSFQLRMIPNLSHRWWNRDETA